MRESAAGAAAAATSERRATTSSLSPPSAAAAAARPTAVQSVPLPARASSAGPSSDDGTEIAEEPANDAGRGERQRDDRPLLRGAEEGTAAREQHDGATGAKRNERDRLQHGDVPAGDRGGAQGTGELATGDDVGETRGARAEAEAVAEPRSANIALDENRARACTGVGRRQPDRDEAGERAGARVAAHAGDDQGAQRPAQGEQLQRGAQRGKGLEVALGHPTLAAREADVGEHRQPKGRRNGLTAAEAAVEVLTQERAEQAEQQPEAGADADIPWRIGVDLPAQRIRGVEDRHCRGDRRSLRRVGAELGEALLDELDEDERRLLDELLRMGATRVVDANREHGGAGVGDDGDLLEQAPRRLLQLQVLNDVLRHDVAPHQILERARDRRRRGGPALREEELRLGAVDGRADIRADGSRPRGNRRDRHDQEPLPAQHGDLRAQVGAGQLETAVGQEGHTCRL